MWANIKHLLDAVIPVAEADEIGTRLAGDSGTKTENNPYTSWIEMYASAEYKEVATGAVAQLDRLASQRLTPARFDALCRTFRRATRLEADFWQMGLTLAA